MERIMQIPKQTKSMNVRVSVCVCQSTGKCKHSVDIIKLLRNHYLLLSMVTG